MVFVSHMAKPSWCFVVIITYFMPVFLAVWHTLAASHLSAVIVAACAL